MKIIAALSRNGVIGNLGKIPWHIPEDFKHFKETTLGHPIVMGRKTWESLPIKPLQGRFNIVLSRRGIQAPGVKVLRSLQEALEVCEAMGKEPFVIGGAELYRLAILKADELILTHVDEEVCGDTFFPDVDGRWVEVDSKVLTDRATVVTYRRA